MDDRRPQVPPADRTRRRVLIGGTAVGVAAWSAPAILGVSTARAAQSGPPVGSSTTTSRPATTTSRPATGKVIIVIVEKGGNVRFREVELVSRFDGPSFAGPTNAGGQIKFSNVPEGPYDIIVDGEAQLNVHVVAGRANPFQIRYR